MTDLLAPFTAAGAVDLTAFIGTWPWRLQIKADAPALSSYADRFGLRSVCVSHIASIFGFDTRSGNEALLDAVAGDERLLPFGVLNPMAPDAPAELRWLIEAGCRGIRLFPGYHGYRPGAAAVRELLDLAGGLPVQIVARIDDERLRHPRFTAPDVADHELAEAIRALRGHRIALSGLRLSDWDGVRAHLNSTDDIARVVLDLWFVNGPARAIEQLCAAGQAGHFAYGSATPVQTAAATAMQLAVAGISAEERHRLGRGNAERFLTGSG
ncbi:MAG TPA: amidohydrolase family protein [Mycobacteriales bacterium]|nr:amidohydrolase family protein [Mycobacteriales bacterium]